MTHSMLRRQLKNLVQNFSEAEVKALTLLEYLLKTGSDRVPQQSVENIHIIKALSEYRFTDKDGKDQGVNVREKAKIVMVLIEDEEKRKEERDFAMKTKDKLTKAPNVSSATVPEKEKPEIPPYTGLPSLDNIPSVADLAAEMARKKEEQKRLEAERKEAERRAKEGDTEPDLWEKGATAQPPSGSDPWGAPSEPSNESATNDPWGAPSGEAKKSSPGTNDPWGGSADGTNGSAPPSNDPWGESADNDSSPVSNDPWGESTNAEKSSPPAAGDPWGDSAGVPEEKAPVKNDPWGASAESPKDSDGKTADPWGAPSESVKDSAPAASDPWGAPLEASSATSDPFGDASKADNDPWGTAASSPPTANDPWGAPSAPADAMTNNDPFGDGGKSDPWGVSSENGNNATKPAEETKKSSFLGDGASLVDLDSLMSVKPKPKQPPLSAIPTQKAPVSSFPGYMPATCMIPPLGANISSAGASSAQPSNCSYFGFNTMTSSSGGLLPINKAFGMPVINMATQNASLSVPNIGFSMANPPMATSMLQPSTGGTFIGEFSSLSLAGTSGTQQAPVTHQSSLVWGTGTGVAGKGNNIF
ncbi:uncharacterized protein isoform X2 [Danio rerio]|uniref:Uncharacterized protein isoform X2 n=1 Tax=Danio rerio TaxID=7955 RepID=A0AC58HZA4_DANRE